MESYHLGQLVGGGTQSLGISTTTTESVVHSGGRLRERKGILLSSSEAFWSTSGRALSSFGSQKMAYVDFISSKSLSFSLLSNLEPCGCVSGEEEAGDCCGEGLRR